MKISAFIATSIDGFIARYNGDIDWLEKANNLLPAGEDCGYARFFNQIDCLVLGRKTFEKVLGFKEWPYGNKSVFVMSKKGIAVPERLSNTVFSTDKSPSALKIELAQKGFSHIYVDGGQVIRSFLSSGLLDEITITRIPVMIHNGISLFNSDDKFSSLSTPDLWFELTESRSWTFGFVQEVWNMKQEENS
ncbi:MAG: hypothetical protein RIR26_2395 [Pseudomonadota bacterium]|jgi:dihydrofolate reductase